MRKGKRDTMREREKGSLNEDSLKECLILIPLRLAREINEKLFSLKVLFLNSGCLCSKNFRRDIFLIEKQSFWLKSTTPKFLETFFFFFISNFGPTPGSFCLLTQEFIFKCHQFMKSEKSVSSIFNEDSVELKNLVGVVIQFRNFLTRVVFTCQFSNITDFSTSF